MLLQSLLLQDKESRDSNLLRKPWYRRAMSATSLYLRKQHPNSNISTKRPAAAAAAGEILGGLFQQPPPPQLLYQQRKMRRCSSLRIAASFSHVCLCVPVSLSSSSSSCYSGGDTSFRADATTASPKTSSSRRSAEAAAKRAVVQLSRSRTSVDGRERRVLFLGRSLLEDVVMRQLAVEMTRGRGEMEVVKRRIAAAGRRRRPPGPSRLSRTSGAEENDSEHP